MHVSKRGQPIDSVDSWFKNAPPKKGLAQWSDGHSAKELAKAFCGSSGVALPQELESLLNSNPSLGPVEIVEAWPEHKIALDSFPGETRNADLAALAKGRDGLVVVTVEAKAQESFGDLIGTVIAKERAKPTSNVPARIEALARGLFGLPTLAVSGLRYQLLHGAAASLILAREHRAVAAVFAVMEFRGSASSKASLRRNESDFERFAAMLGRSGESVRLGFLSGPFAVPGAGPIPSDLPLFLGKVVRAVGRSKDAS